jgi:putative ABC transport system permease protein
MIRKYMPLVWGALMRKKTRTAFTLLSLSAAFLLIGLLQAVNSVPISSVPTG